MAIAKRFPIEHEAVFPRGAFLRGHVEPVPDFQGEQLPDGSRPQQRDRETSLPLWQCTVMDMDEGAARKDIGVVVKFASAVVPTEPKNGTPFPWTPVKFLGLSALPYIDDGGGRARIAWSFRAESMTAAHELGKPEQGVA